MPSDSVPVPSPSPDQSPRLETQSPCLEQAQQPLGDAPFRFGKSAAIGWLSTRIQSAEVPMGVTISARNWKRNSVSELNRLRTILPKAPYAVRSDAACEDQLAGSHAGRYLSLLDVDDNTLAMAVARVLASLPRHPQDAVLIQSMVGACRQVGVATTHRSDDGAPWVCIEASDGRQGSAVVTSGRATGRQRAWPRAALTKGIPDDIESVAGAVLTLLQEIETLLPGQPLEIEWAAPADGRPLQLLQCRPLASKPRWPPQPQSRLAEPRFTFDGDRSGLVLGKRTVLSLMADWNPAELIGRHPRPLALDVFRDSISRGT